MTPSKTESLKKLQPGSKTSFSYFDPTNIMHYLLFPSDVGKLENFWNFVFHFFTLFPRLSQRQRIIIEIASAESVYFFSSLDWCSSYWISMLGKLLSRVPKYAKIWGEKFYIFNYNQKILHQSWANGENHMFPYILVCLAL